MGLTYYVMLLFFLLCGQSILLPKRCSMAFAMIIYRVDLAGFNQIEMR